MSRVLVIGGGGREHALVWKLRQSSQVERVFCAPGNAGIRELAECVPLDVSGGVPELIRFVKDHAIDFTVVGPEAPLVEGLVDRFTEANLAIFGPGQAAAQLEGSKAFAKGFMARYGIPTARWQVVRSWEEAQQAIRQIALPVVVKADGLAAGKGVTISETKEEALHTLESLMLRDTFGPAGKTVVLEECLQGEEASVMAFCDGQTLLPLPSSQDHKRVWDQDQGPNTGGMGAYAPAPVVTDTVMRHIESSIFTPFLKGLAAERLSYHGLIYFGLMLTSQGPKVLEFNVRFGDPETQAVLPLLQDNLLDLLGATVQGRLRQMYPDGLKVQSGSAVCVVLASGGYPGRYVKGKPIAGLTGYSAAQVATDSHVTVFHAGTAREGQTTITSGGRVLGVTAVDTTIEQAIQRAYQAVKKIHFEGMHYRRDIAARALKVLQRTSS
ncbi:MAG: phosphoribosylamine--glycine ligase [Elusimicrobia bacterium]|nr:phosphoribosylamine--glycine ligase [Elusimicrobiota bacterium]